MDRKQFQNTFLLIILLLTTACSSSEVEDSVESSAFGDGHDSPRGLSSNKSLPWILPNKGLVSALSMLEYKKDKSPIWGESEQNN